jgi:hypothetical protein
MKNLGRNSVLLIAILFHCLVFGKDVPINRDFLHLPNGRWIWLQKIDWDATKAMIGKGLKRESNVIWSRIFKSDENRAWEYAYFVRLKPKKFAVDLDRDGNFEVGISTYDMGNNMIRKVMIFSVIKDQLVLVREQGPYNIAADESVFD